MQVLVGGVQRSKKSAYSTFEMKSTLTFDSLTPKRKPTTGVSDRVLYVTQPEYGYGQTYSSYWDWTWTWIVFGFFACVAVSVLVVEVIFYATSPVMPDSALCTREYVEADSDAQRFRAILSAPNGFSSCAVVGSAGFLRLQRLGDEIDEHEFVIRANLAPVSGFEPIVGSKTSLRIVNSEALGSILHEKSCSNSSSIRSSMCSSYPVYLNTGDWWMVSKYRKMCPNTVVFDNTDLDAWDPSLHAQWQGIGTNLMSGAYAIAVALKLCPNGTTVYGVSHEGTFDLNNNESATYHYYDERQQSAYDSLPKSASALTRFSETQNECLQLHSPSTLHSKFVLPRRNATSKLTDALVDDVLHDRGRGYYLSHKHLCL